jgi:hypothetical protein
LAEDVDESDAADPAEIFVRWADADADAGVLFVGDDEISDVAGTSDSAGFAVVAGTAVEGASAGAATAGCFAATMEKPPPPARLSTTTFAIMASRTLVIFCVGM